MRQSECDAELAATTAEPFYSIEGLLEEIDGFCEKDIKKRIYPHLTMKDAKSIICFLFPYKNTTECFSGGRAAENTGKIVSGDVWLGEDYHIYVMDKLRIICETLKQNFGGNYMPFCDTGPLVDKEIAVRSGLCRYGRNSLAINERYGSFFYIGYILANQLIEGSVVRDTSALYSLCNNCGKCADACPSGALSRNKPFDYKRCISYISQKKGELTPEESRLLGNKIYGCHMCQNVCPANSNNVYEKYVDLNEQNISNREFKRKFGDTAAVFIGKKLFLRNAEAVLDNYKNRVGD